MRSFGVYRAVLLGLAALLAGCGLHGRARQRAFSRRTLKRSPGRRWEPNTSSHDRSNWKVVEVQSVQGAQVAEEFDAWVFYGYCPGPEPPRNQTVDPGQTYWLARFEALRATPAVTPLSPTAPPAIPEPFLYQAGFFDPPGHSQVLAVITTVSFINFRRSTH